VYLALAAIKYLFVAPHCIKECAGSKWKNGLYLTEWTVSCQLSMRSLDPPNVESARAACVREERAVRRIKRSEARRNPTARLLTCSHKFRFALVGSLDHIANLNFRRSSGNEGD